MINAIKNKDNSESRHYYILLWVIISFILLQSLFFLQKQNFFSDEEFAILLAVGKMSNYVDIVNAKKYPYGELVDIKEYKNLFKIDKKFCFGKIKKDVALFDVHPPLYFWLLHIWIIITGGTAYFWTANLLNLFLCMFIILILYMLALKCFQSYEDALFSSILFALSPMINLSNFARPYFLLTLIIVLCSYLLIGFIKKSKKLNIINFILFSFLICLGFLCHYAFNFICIAWLIFLSIHCWKENKALISYYILSCLLGLLLFCNIYPGFINNFINYNTIRQQNAMVSSALEMQNLQLDLKVSKIIASRLSPFFSSHQKELAEFLLGSSMFYYIIISTIAFFCLWIWFSIRKNKLFGFIFASFFYPLFLMIFLILRKVFFFWFITESHFLFITPFIYLCIIFFLKEKFFNFKKIILICLCQILFFSTVDDLIAKAKERNSSPDIALCVSAYVDDMQDKYNRKYVVLDNADFYDWGWGVGKIFKVMHYFPEDTKIILADAPFLISNYSIYFGDKSRLPPLIYITFLDALENENNPSHILIKKFVGDEHIKTRVLLFNRISREKELVFMVDRTKKDSFIK